MLCVNKWLKEAPTQGGLNTSFKHNAKIEQGIEFVVTTRYDIQYSNKHCAQFEETIFRRGTVHCKKKKNLT